MGDRPPGGPDEVNNRIIEREGTEGMENMNTRIHSAANEIIENYKAKLAPTNFVFTEYAFTDQDTNVDFQKFKSEIYLNTHAIIKNAVWQGHIYSDSDQRYINGCPLAIKICEELIIIVNDDNTYDSDNKKHYITDMATHLIRMYDPDTHADVPPRVHKKDEDRTTSQKRSIRKDQLDRPGVQSKGVQSKAILQTMDRLLNLL
jgi:predicted  nucleic acid-binding Zn-ribbon protein